MSEPGGRLYLSAPNFYYHPMTEGDLGPFHDRGWGPCAARLFARDASRALRLAGFDVEDIDYVSYFFSQWLTSVIRIANKLFGAKVGWVLTSPLRILPLALDQWLGRWLGELTGRPGLPSPWSPISGVSRNFRHVSP